MWGKWTAALMDGQQGKLARMKYRLCRGMIALPMAPIALPMLVLLTETLPVSEKACSRLIDAYECHGPPTRSAPSRPSLRMP